MRKRKVESKTYDSSEEEEESSESSSDDYFKKREKKKKEMQEALSKQISDFSSIMDKIDQLDPTIPRTVLNVLFTYFSPRELMYQKKKKKL